MDADQENARNENSMHKPIFEINVSEQLRSLCSLTLSTPPFSNLSISNFFVKKYFLDSRMDIPLDGMP